MHRIFLWVALAAPWCSPPAHGAVRTERGSLTFDDIPEPTAELRAGLEAYQQGRDAAPLDWTPKGQLIIESRFGEVRQLHLLEHAVGERRQISFGVEPITQCAFSPDPSRSAYVYLQDSGGNDNAQLYYQRLGEPAPRRLTDGKSLNGGPVWSNTGREVAYFTASTDGAYDIQTVVPESGVPPRTVLAGDAGGALSVLDWSPDDRKLLVRKFVSAAESYLYVLDLSSGQKREVEPSPAKVGIVTARFSRDGVGVFLVSDRDSEFMRLRYVGLFGNDKTVILSSPSAGDIEELALARDGRYLAYTSGEGGTDRLNVLDFKSRQELTPPHLPAAGIIRSLKFDIAGQRLAFGFETAREPRDAYVLDVPTNHVEPWTRSEAGPLDALKLVTPRTAQFPTFDRVEGRPRELPAFVYEPALPGPHPVLILLHGGPESQFRPRFDAWLQYVVGALGYVVVAPNVRGSTGYGKSYAALDNGTLREDAVKDVGALLVWIALQSNLDARRVVVAGSGYGGYLALAAMVNYGERLRGAIDIGGFGDFVSFLEGTAAYRRNLRRAEYGDERDEETRAYLRRISPLQNADRISKPLLVVAGKNDARVPPREADQIVNRLRAKGVPVWYLTAADEGHEFRKQHDRDALELTVAQFLVAK